MLEYSVLDKPFPTALLELCEAVRYIREHRKDLCATDDITVMGFSAGGHLAASLGVYGREYGGDPVIPDRLILCYPVITSGRYTHRESAMNIAPTAELTDKISLEDHISADFPPCFIWHCADDRTVPVQNSLILAQKLTEHDIPYEMHIFPSGGHGIAMCDVTTVKDENYDKYINPTCARWTDLALDWLKRNQK
ncbi:MAG: alpha/beta hydrolase [Oscillospiraceae bacterium]|nr:alpha/beta hydrolase [Oscillospiraceae bacterium]